MPQAHITTSPPQFCPAPCPDPLLCSYSIPETETETSTETYKILYMMGDGAEWSVDHQDRKKDLQRTGISTFYGEWGFGGLY